MTSPAATTFDAAPAPSLLRRVYALALRHIYLYKGSWPRLVEMMYWPILNTMTFGFISLAIARHLGHRDGMTETFFCGVLLMEIFTRNTTALLVMHLEEIWSRNLGHLFASPLRVRDYIGSLIALSSARAVIAVIPAFVAIYFLFDFSILKLGFLLPVYIVLLCISSWWFGLLVLSILLRYGLAAEWMGWMCAWLLMPFMAPYYPVDILPWGFRAVSLALPGTYVFESMKAQLATGAARFDQLGICLILNIAYFAAAALVFRKAFRAAKNAGGLLQMGE